MMSDLSNASEDTVQAAAEAPAMPAWFDAEIHRVADGGIFETATGVLLDEDGGPKSLAVRLMRADAAEAAEAAAAAAAAESAPAKKGRDTRAIVEAAAAAANKE